MGKDSLLFRDAIFFMSALVRSMVLFVSIANAAEVRLEWLPISDAAQYELEITRMDTKTGSRTNAPAPDFQRLTKSSAQVTLEPGSYNYRVRAIYHGDESGPWSDPLGFVVEFKPIVLTEPDDQITVDLNSNSNTVLLRWKAGHEGSRYRTQIIGTSGVLVDEEVSASSMEWRPSQTGLFRWRVSYVNATTQIWSETRSVQVIRKDNAPPPKISSPPTKARRPGIQSSFTHTFWLGPSWSIYEGTFVDLSNSVAAQTLSDNYGFDFKLQDSENLGGWRLSGGLNRVFPVFTA
jgi:hypothetical protein